MSHFWLLALSELYYNITAGMRYRSARCEAGSGLTRVLCSAISWARGLGHRHGAAGVAERGLRAHAAPAASRVQDQLFPPT